ncbi:hypothetical protein [Sulfuriflexus mobilis]|uniref:hypothetical protein n=1 Tax=Sulfuriflexus mobilis TaxID=1811807 RepID=UPI000F82CB5A|nr:hypothetical protein [Sulfuriflexus mobilis]
MSILLKVNLAILVFLAASSGVTKIMLMPQDVEFFGNYGFTNPILMLFTVWLSWVNINHGLRFP